MSLALDLSHEPRTGIPHGKLVMWAFLASEIMFFSGFFGAFIVLRQSNIDIFTHSSHELNWKLAMLNTFFLIGSSFTMALSIMNLEKKDKGKFQLFMGLTILCACGFLVVKYFEYSAKFGHMENGHPHPILPSTNIFFAFYFLMTGFHAMHVIGGMIPMGWMFFRSFTKKGYHNATRVEVLGLYWHFVDLVWIFLFPALYLLFPTM
ncbi:MAG: cytochrome c oxidase subunit 3 [Candidatus Kapabacteria bacterium]|nr:cytochrome c oxidase subunit 3 [Candidatus Kapabacteria bacterium]